METPLELHCVLDCSASMHVWQKLYIAHSSVDLLQSQPIFRSEQYPDLSHFKVWFWGLTVSNQPPAADTNISMAALEDWLNQLVDSSSSQVVRVLLFSDGCGAMNCSNSLHGLLGSRVHMSVIGVGPDQDVAQLKALSSCGTVYSTADLDRALSEVLSVPLVTEGQIEQDLEFLTQTEALALQNQGKEKDPW